MADLRDRVAELVERRPEIESKLRELLAIDDDGPWEFQDIPLDSGDFGEVVSRGIAVETDEGYRIADREAVKAALDGTDPAELEVDDPDDRPAGLLPQIGSIDVDRSTALALAGALVVLAAVRLTPYANVFRNGDVVLYPNDPYLYRYWADQLTAQASSPMDLGPFLSLPESAAEGEPLMIATVSWLSELFGGGSGASGTVLAWYPVVAAVLTALAVYALARAATNDRRIGVSAVLMLAVTPMHTFRTGLGFGDHHAFDYVWLGFTALTLLIVLDSENRLRLSSPQSWIAPVFLGFAAAAQTLAWEAGALLLLPLLGVAFVDGLSAVRGDESPIREGSPVIAGTAIGAVLVLVAHFVLNWHSTVVAVVPVVLTVFVGGTYLAAEIPHRYAVSVRTILAIELGGVALISLGVVALLPDLVTTSINGISRLFGNTGISETTSLVKGPIGIVTGPVLNFGLVFLLALPYLVWFSRRIYQQHSPRWIVPVVYSWFFLTLALVQVRFAGQLSLFLAVFSGAGLVHVAAWVDVARPLPALGFSDVSGESTVVKSLRWPGTRTVVYLAVFWLLIAGPGLFVSLSYVDTASISEDRYSAMVAVRDYANEESLSYPNDYVLSDWSYNRMYNYFVNGQSRSYSYAFYNYPAVTAATDPNRRYRSIRDRVGFLVLERADSTPGRAPLVSGLLGRTENGTIGDQTLAHYRVIWASKDRDFVVVRVLNGGTVSGMAPNATNLTVTTSVDVHGVEFTYERQVRVGDDGRFSVVVSYPGRYRVGDRTVEVSEAMVENGGTARVDLTDSDG
jgi:dolichyl-diphosphooligosaccharide--protein glycosyltransferase